MTHSATLPPSIDALRNDHSPSETWLDVEKAENDFRPMSYIQAPSIKKSQYGLSARAAARRCCRGIFYNSRVSSLCA
jgi:hypothetical protein